MQFPIFLTMAFATAIFAAPSERLNTRATCTYETANYLSVCKQGNNVFCGGNTNVCPSGKTDTFDTKATEANEASCSDIAVGESCVQTVACC